MIDHVSAAASTNRRVDLVKASRSGGGNKMSQPIMLRGTYTYMVKNMDTVIARESSSKKTPVMSYKDISMKVHEGSKSTLRTSRGLSQRITRYQVVPESCSIVLNIRDNALKKKKWLIQWIYVEPFPSRFTFFRPRADPDHACHSYSWAWLFRNNALGFHAASHG